MNSEVCSDDRFELIAKAKAELLDATNIESSPTDMAALDSILFRCWQMGWLDHLRKPRTLEDVLRDVWKEALDYAKSDIWRNPDEVFAERADEIRELIGVGE